jgi:hypothetical protein
MLESASIRDRILSQTITTPIFSERVHAVYADVLIYFFVEGIVGIALPRTTLFNT